MKRYGIYDKVVGFPASSLSQLRGPWPENIEDPWFRRETGVKEHKYYGNYTAGIWIYSQHVAASISERCKNTYSGRNLCRREPAFLLH